jgi:predicted transcriptional regulator
VRAKTPARPTIRLAAEVTPKLMQQVDYLSRLSGQDRSAIVRDALLEYLPVKVQQVLHALGTPAKVSCAPAEGE